MSKDLGAVCSLGQGKPSHPREPQAPPEPASRVARAGVHIQVLISYPHPPPPPGWAPSAPCQHFQPHTTAHPRILLDHIGYFCPKPHPALFKEWESWDCGNPVKKAFSTPAVTKWKSVLEAKQPEIAELGLLQRLLEKTLPKVGRAAGHQEEPRARASGSQSHRFGAEKAGAPNSSGWAFVGAAGAEPHPELLLEGQAGLKSASCGWRALCSARGRLLL